MKRISVHIVAPHKLKGICSELAHIRDYCGESVYLQVVGYDADMKSFEKAIVSDVNFDCLLVFDAAREAINPERIYTRLLTILKKIKLQQSAIRIVVVFDAKSTEDIPLINEFIKIGINDLYFTNEFNLDDIASWILGTPKELKDIEQFISPSFAQKAETKIVERIVEKIVEVPVERQAPAKEGLLRKAPWNRKRDERMDTPRASGARVIGVLGSGYGAGATSCCVSLAKQFAVKGKTALIERNGSRQLELWADKIHQLKGIDFYEEIPFRECWRNYDYIVVDYGVYLRLSAGAEYVAEVLDDPMRSKMAEMLFCDHTVLVASSSPWRASEIMFYIEDQSIAKQSQDWIFYLPDWTDYDMVSAERITIGGPKETAVLKLWEQIENQC